jgi:hypothetical protein
MSSESDDICEALVGIGGGACSDDEIVERARSRSRRRAAPVTRGPIFVVAVVADAHQQFDESADGAEELMRLLGRRQRDVGPNNVILGWLALLWVVAPLRGHREPLEALVQHRGRGRGRGQPQCEVRYEVHDCLRLEHPVDVTWDIRTLHGLSRTREVCGATVAGVEFVNTFGLVQDHFISDECIAASAVLGLLPTASWCTVFLKQKHGWPFVSCPSLSHRRAFIAQNPPEQPVVQVARLQVLGMWAWGVLRLMLRGLCLWVMVGPRSGARAYGCVLYSGSGFQNCLGLGVLV